MILCYLENMSDTRDNDERMILAIGQMERALSRMESASAKLNNRPQAADGDGEAEKQLESLKKQHANLRSAAENAIRQIDQLTGQG